MGRTLSRQTLLVLRCSSGGAWRVGRYDVDLTDGVAARPNDAQAGTANDFNQGVVTKILEVFAHGNKPEWRQESQQNPASRTQSVGSNQQPGPPHDPSEPPVPDSAGKRVVRPHFVGHLHVEPPLRRQQLSQSRNRSSRTGHVFEYLRADYQVPSPGTKVALRGRIYAAPGLRAGKIENRLFGRGDFFDQAAVASAEIQDRLEVLRRSARGQGTRERSPPLPRFKP